MYQSRPIRSRSPIQMDSQNCPKMFHFLLRHSFPPKTTTLLFYHHCRAVGDLEENIVTFSPTVFQDRGGWSLIRGQDLNTKMTGKTTITANKRENSDYGKQGTPTRSRRARTRKKPPSIFRHGVKWEKILVVVGAWGSDASHASRTKLVAFPVP